MRFFSGSAPVGALFAVSLLCGSSARAEDQLVVLGEKSSTAPGVEAAREEAARVPGGANVVALDEYADGRASNLLDVLRLTPGIIIQPRFGAEEARLSIRGSGLQRTFHLRGINLLQDGVPITLADGGGDFQAIEPLALAYTEVMRGANALRYGGSTLGGSINFVSPSGHDGAGWRPRLEAGSFGYQRAFISFGSGDESRDFFVAASASRQEGYRAWSRQENLRLSGDAGFRLSDRTESRFYFTALQSDSQLPGSLTKAQLAFNPEQANPNNLAGRQKRDYDLYRLANRTVLEWGEDSLELSASYSYKDLWHPIFQVLQQKSDDYSAGIRYLDNYMIGGRSGRLVAGASPSWNVVQDDRFVNLAGEAGARTAESQQRSRNLALYLENQLDVSAAVTLVTGAQWTASKRRYEDAFLGNGDQSLDATYTRLSPKLGLLWRLGAEQTVFGNISDSFEPPSFGELSGGPGVNLLDAQRARTVEVGTRGRAGRLKWDLAAYSAEVRNELLGLNTPTGQPLGTVNAPRTVHRGIEAGIELSILPAVSWRTSALVNRFRFDGNASYGDNDLPGVPKQLYRSELAWSFAPQYNIMLSGEWSPQRYAIDMANSWFADAYALWGLKLARTREKGLSWFVEGRNLADRRYASATGVVADAGGADLAQFLPGDGRAVYAGFEWRMN